MLGQRVTRTIWQDTKWTLVTDAQETVQAEKVYFCGGLIPNSEFMRQNFTHVLNAQGFLQVQPNLALKGYSNIFALGDIVGGIPDLKTAYVAGEHAKHLIGNLKHIREGKSVSTYKPQGLSPFLMAISMGAFRGIFIFGGKVASTKDIAVGTKNKFEYMIIGELGQEKTTLKTDYNKLLRDELKTNKKNLDDGEDATEADAETLKKLFASAEEATGDVFH